jgi:hypothetical protein
MIVRSTRPLLTLSPWTRLGLTAVRYQLSDYPKPKATSRWPIATLAVLASLAGVQTLVAQSWVNFTNETSTRLIANPSVGSADVEEKDYAWGDFDQDGDIDLVVVRKTPFSVVGRKRNVLFMNEGVAQGHSINGVLVDRTAQYASAADDGGQGMLDLTDDRDVAVADVNNDGWLDIITATTYGNGLPKSISHPRIYINRGEIAGAWQGFKYEQARIPQLPAAPNFCGVAAGDVTGNKAPDLYFTEYDRITTTPFDDRLLVNNGSGFFTDQSSSRFSPISLLDSSFGTACHLVDINGDGKLDVLRSENGPVKIIYNNGNGSFTNLQTPYAGSAYFVSPGDLNGDGRLDLVISDDGTDRYLINTGNGANGQATFATLTFPPSSGGFGSSSRFADLNNDTNIDVIICDVDVDLAGCSRQMRIYRNLGNAPNVTLADQGPGNIPSNMLNGTFDVAVFDINSDGWLDLVVGRCASTEVWINQPPSGLVFSYPEGLPGFLPSNQPVTFKVQVAAVGGGTPTPNSGVLRYSVNGGSYVNSPMTVIAGNLYSATLPATQCTDIVRFYVSAQMNSTTFYDPPNAPTSTYAAVSADGTQISMEETFEASTAGWNVVNDPSLTGGAWERVEPVGTINGTSQAAPNQDAGNGDDVMAFVTQNGVTGGPPNAADVDLGPTYLISPIINLAGTDATISYDRWFYCEDAGTADGDFLTTEVSNNGGANWVFVHRTAATAGAWQTATFRVGEFVTPTSQVRVRFWTSDIPNNSITEAGIDNFTVEQLICAPPPPACPADISPPPGGNGWVNIDDLFAVINAWGQCPGPCPPSCRADIDHNCWVTIDDLFAVISAWGQCPQ